MMVIALHELRCSTPPKLLNGLIPSLAVSLIWAVFETCVERNTYVFIVAILIDGDR